MITEDEARQLLSIMAVIYPNIQISEATIEPTIKIYQRIFAKYKYQELENALEIYSTTNMSGFPPQPAHLIDIIESAYESENKMDDSEVWKIIYNAVCRSSYKAEEDFNNFPPIIQRVVGSPNQLREWGQTSIDIVNGSVKTSVMINYHNIVKEEKVKNRMPNNSLSQIEKLAGKNTEHKFIENENDITFLS